MKKVIILAIVPLMIAGCKEHNLSLLEQVAALAMSEKYKHCDIYDYGHKTNFRDGERKLFARKLYWAVQ